MTQLGTGNLLLRARYVAAGLLSPACRGRRIRATAVVGHRGAAREAPENTVASFARAAAHGADAVETDVCATRDGRFVLWHDADPDEPIALVRQIGGEGYAYRPEAPALGSRWRRPVRELSLEELRAHYRLVPSGSDGGRAAPGPVETLDDLLDWLRRERALRRLFVDVKLAPGEMPAARDLFELLRRAAAEEALRGTTFHLLSPQAEVVAALARAHADAGRPDRVRVSADFELPAARRGDPGCGADDRSMGLGRRLWPGFRRELCAVLRDRDAGRLGYVTAWTINEGRRLRQLVRMGVDAILTDDAGTLRRLVGSPWQGDC